MAVSHALTRTNLDVEWTLPVDVDVRHGIFGGIASLPHASVGATRNPRRLFVDSIGQVTRNHSHSPLGGHVAYVAGHRPTVFKPCSRFIKYSYSAQKVERRQGAAPQRSGKRLPLRTTLTMVAS
jgi:hypothetical protein